MDRMYLQRERYCTSFIIQNGITAAVASKANVKANLAAQAGRLELPAKFSS